MSEGIAENLYQFWIKYKAGEGYDYSLLSIHKIILVRKQLHLS